MWAKIDDSNNITEIIRFPKALTVDGIAHSRAIFSSWTNSELKAIGILPVTMATQLNGEYYTARNATYAIAGDGNSVTETIAKASDNNLAKVQERQLLKIKQKAYSLLQPTDWYVTRKTENNTAVPAKITAFRTAVRTVYSAAKDAINGASDIDALLAVNTNSNGASSDTKEVNGTSTGVVSTSNNTISISNHGFVDDELVNYTDGQDDADNPIKGLVSEQSYYIIGKTTNTFKLSHTPRWYGDEAAISLTGVADAGTAHTFTSMGKLKIVNDWPARGNLAYKV